MREERRIERVNELVINGDLTTSADCTHQMSRLAFLLFLLVQRAILSPFFLRDTTAPFTR